MAGDGAAIRMSDRDERYVGCPTEGSKADRSKPNEMSGSTATLRTQIDLAGGGASHHVAPE
jgi:hypothetical protein